MSVSWVKSLTFDCADALVTGPGGDVQAEVARLERLGATVVTPGPDLTVMEDPEGNVFCVEN